MGLELDKAFNAHKDKTRERWGDTSMAPVHVFTKNTRGFLGILWVAQLGITLSLPVINEEDNWNSE